MSERLGLPAAVREGLAPDVQAYLVGLEEQVAALQAQVAGLQTQLEILQARLGQTSQNSSRPPSADPPDAPPRPQAPASGRKRGAQPGHPGHQRSLLEVSEVDAVEVHWPSTCPHCATPLPQVATPETAPLRQQVWEVPPIEPYVVEHQYPSVCCPQCQQTVRAARPVMVPPGAFGPHLSSVVGLLNGRYRLSKREVANLLDEAFGVTISVGAVVRATEHLSAALAAPYEQVQRAIGESAVTNVDETGWKQAGQRRWLWVAVSAVATLFLLASSRAGQHLDTLLGAAYGGIVGSDRFRAYLRLPLAQRQLCWAHLKRDLVAFSQASGAAGAWGTRALEVVAQLFALWHRFRHGDIDRATLQAQMEAPRTTFATLLSEGRDLPAWTNIPGFCRDLQALEPALWTFLFVEGVEPTNNAAERALRPAVLWRKGSFGSFSDGGLRFVERILTVTATCKQQQRPLLPFLTEALQAHWALQPAPSLLPAP